MRRLLGKLLPFLFLIVMVIVLSLTTKGFAKPKNIGDILRFSSMVIIMGVGMTFVIVSAGIDLSVGSVLAFSGVIAAWCVLNGVPLILSLALGVATGTAWGLVNGVLIISLRLPPFVATLATMGIARGSGKLLARHITGLGTSVTVRDEAFGFLGSGPFYVYLPVPALVCLVALILWRRLPRHAADDPPSSGRRASALRPAQIAQCAACAVALACSFSQFGAVYVSVVPFPVVVMGVIVAAGHYVLNHTRLGRYTFAIGSNVQAARYSGIPVNRYTLYVYVILGALAGVAGMIQASINSGGIATTARGYELHVIAAVVIGGGSLSGGAGTILGTVAGALIMAVIRNGCILLGVVEDWQQVIVGALIVVAVAFDTYRRRRTGT